MVMRAAQAANCDRIFAIPSFLEVCHLGQRRPLAHLRMIILGLVPQPRVCNVVEYTRGGRTHLSVLAYVCYELIDVSSGLRWRSSEQGDRRLLSFTGSAHLQWIWNVSMFIYFPHNC